jgi:hypothetical protein
MRTSPQTQQDERQLVRLSSGLTDLRASDIRAELAVAS